MVSTDSSTDDGSSSMDGNEKRFYSQTKSASQAPPSTEPESDSEFESSSEQVSSRSQQKRPAPTSSVNRNPRTPPPPKPPSLAKRPREQEEEKERQHVGGIESATKKSKKAKPQKKISPIDKPKRKENKSNGDNKKGKKPVLESAGGPSPQKSVKRNGQKWNPTDEIAFLKCLVAYSRGGKEFPKSNMTPVYDYVRNLHVLDDEYSNSQLGDKLRRLRTKYNDMADKVKSKNFSFKTSHEETLYGLSNKVWGSRGEEEEGSEDEEIQKSEEHPVKAEMPSRSVDEKPLKEVEEVDEEEGEGEGEEEENKSTSEDIELTQKENDEDIEMTQMGNDDDDDEDEEDQEEDAELNSKENSALPVSNGASKRLNPNPNPNSNPRESSMGVVPAEYAQKLIDQFREESSRMWNETKDQLRREVEEVKSDMIKMVKEELQGFMNTGTSFSNSRTSNDVKFSSEEMLKRMASARDLPPLNGPDAKKLEQEWHKQHLVELDACSGRLALLQHECKLRMKKVRTVVNKENP